MPTFILVDTLEACQVYVNVNSVSIIRAVSETHTAIVAGGKSIEVAEPMAQFMARLQGETP